jgi:hypothetical protein
MTHPLSSFQSTGVYSGDYTRAFGQVGDIWRFQTVPIAWSKGRGGKVFDTLQHSTLRGANEQTRKAITNFWEAEEKTMRQLRWNYQTGTATPLPGYKDRLQTTFYQDAGKMQTIQKDTSWYLMGLAALGVYVLTK